jgi:uncharacterized protein
VTAAQSDRVIEAAASLPSAAGDFHIFETEDGPHLLLVDGSQIYQIDEALERRLRSARTAGGAALSRVLSEHGLSGPRFMGQRCNLGCTCCYAEGGSFGGAPRDMPWDIAAASVRRLMSDAKPGGRVNLAFLGGEPLVNRELVRQATELAVEVAAARKIAIGFSITTNGTLLNSTMGGRPSLQRQLLLTNTQKRSISDQSSDTVATVARLAVPPVRNL